MNNKDTEKDPYTLHIHLRNEGLFYILLTHTPQINCWNTFDALNIKTEFPMKNFSRCLRLQRGKSIIFKSEYLAKNQLMWNNTTGNICVALNRK